jgi:hypothetical protein
MLIERWERLGDLWRDRERRADRRSHRTHDRRPVTRRKPRGVGVVLRREPRTVHRERSVGRHRRALYLWWLGAVRVVLLRAEPPPAGLVSLVVYGGIVALIFGLAGSAVGTAYPASVDFYDDFGGDGRLAMLLNTTAYWLGGMSFAGAFVMKAAVAVIVFRTVLLPRWFGWLTATAAVLEIAGSAVWPVGAVVSLAWVVTFAIVMLRSAERAPFGAATRSK